MSGAPESDIELVILLLLVFSCKKNVDNTHFSGLLQTLKWLTYEKMSSLSDHQKYYLLFKLPT